MHKNVLVLVPHPDDAEFYAGGLISKLAAEGARITIAVATNGNKGTLEYSSEELVPMRKQEATLAAREIGAEPPIFLGHPDFELDRLPAGVLREEFVRLIRTIRPDTLIAQDAFASDEVHPDHRIVAWTASDAVNYATLPLIYPQHRQEGLEPHFVLDKYFYSESNRGVNYFVDISNTFDHKIAALSQHHSQVTFMVADIRQQLKLAGTDLDTLLPEISHDPQAVMAWAMRQISSEIGKACGLALAEAYRHESFRLFPFIIEDSQNS